MIKASLYIAHRSHAIDNLRCEVGERQDKMVCQLARCIPRFFNVVFVFAGALFWALWYHSEFLVSAKSSQINLASILTPPSPSPKRVMPKKTTRFLFLVPGPSLLVTKDLLLIK